MGSKFFNSGIEIDNCNMDNLPLILGHYDNSWHYIDQRIDLFRHIHYGIF